MADDVYVGDVGTRFHVIIEESGAVLDVSSSTAKKIILRKPDGVTRMEKTAQFETDGTDGDIYYDSIAGDIDVPGTWDIEGWVQFSSGSWFTTISTFEVKNSL